MKKSLYEIKTVVIRTPNRSNAVRAYQAFRSLRKPVADVIRVRKNIGSGSTSYVSEVSDLKSTYNRLMVSEYKRRVSRFLYGRVFAADIDCRSNWNEALHVIRSDIKRVRRNMRCIYDDQLHGKISTREIGYFLKRYRDNALKTAKSPRTNDSFVGIEIECVIPSNADTSKLMPYAKWVNVGSDGSISYGDGETGAEIRVCVERENVRKVLPPIMAALVSMGAYVNKSCGLHVHLDQRNNPEPSSAYANLVRSLNLLYTVVPASRRDNSYCKRNRSTNFDSARAGGRYKAINASAYNRHRTIEIRLFGGTLDATKVINWIETLYAIASGSCVLRCPKTFENARKYWNISDENLTWLKARQEKFSQLNADAPAIENTSDETMTDDEIERELAEVV